MSQLVSYQEYIEIFIALGMIGLLGIISNKKNLLISLISVEMMFYGFNLAFLIISLYLDDIKGAIASIYTLTLAGADSAVALALISIFYKAVGSIQIQENI
jgi:NADH-quinone oxidoreductase subunit K